MSSADSIAPILMPIPGGVFVMGSADEREDEAPPHEVLIDAFSMARFAVTNREFQAFLEATGVPPPPAWGNPPFDNPDQPVVAVNWFDAVAYCEWLSGMLDERFRLPTEAEREMACRAGTIGAYPWGDAAARDLGDYGLRWEKGGPECVGGPDNLWGLCNMADNVHEWCLDWYAPDYYPSSPRENPRGPASGVRRASRGGSWRHQVKVTRSAARSALDPTFRYTDYGFRAVRENGDSHQIPQF